MTADHSLLGINTILRNIKWNAKDCILYFDTVYGAIEKTLVSLVETNPQVILRKVGAGQSFGYTLPCTHPEILNAFSQTISRILYDGYTPRAAVFDTIVSIPGVRFPFERLTRMCKEYGILSVIDGAHAVGQIPLNLSQLDADFFVSNCHKWLYTPRGCALLHVPKRNHHLIRTTFPTSHGYVPPPDMQGSIRNPLPPVEDKSEFLNLFQFVATVDNSPYYCVPAALNFRQNLCQGGEDGIYTYIRENAQRGADLLAMTLGTEVMDDMDEGRGLKTMGSLEGSDRGRTGWDGGLRDCAMANVLLPIHIAGANSVGSLAGGPGGSGGAGGLSPLHGQGRKGSYGFSGSGTGSGSHSPANSLGPIELEPPGAPWMSREISTSPKGSPLLTPTASGPIVIQKPDVRKHTAWMERTLNSEFNTFVPIFEYNGKVWTRVCGQIYLELRDYEWLGGVLKALCERVRQGEALKDDENRLSRPKTRGASVDLEALGRSISEVRIGPPVVSAGGSRRFDITKGAWVEV